MFFGRFTSKPKIKMSTLGGLFVFYFLLFILPAYAAIYTSPDGYRFEVNIRLQKPVIMLGEPSYLDFEIKNLSAVDLGVLEGGDYRNEFGRPESFDVKIFDSKKRQLEKPATFTMGGLSSFQKATVGGVKIIRLYLPHWGKIEHTGRYTIVISKGLNIRKYPDNFKPEYTDEPKVNVLLTAKLNVIAADYQRMGSVVEEIGHGLASRDLTAEKLVPFINDPRIVPYLSVAIDKNHFLMHNLARFNTDEALNAIIKNIDSDDEQVRRSVSLALSLSVHPKAISYLLKMRTDKSYAIRLDVVHFLGKIKSAESTEILRSMVNDENQQFVGKEARRYLAERGEIIE